MTRFFAVIAFVLMMFAPGAYAADAAPQTANQVQQELIQKLVSEGYMTAASAAAATPSIQQSNAKVAAEETWTRHLSWVNLIKVVAVILLLVAFSGVIVNIVKGVWMLIIAVPTYVYQGAFLAVSLTATILPAVQPMSQGFYLALFGSFANLILAYWVISVYPQVQAFLKKLFSLGIPEFIIASLWATAYFAALAFTYNSAVFGFFAVVGFSGIFGFGLYYMPGVLFLKTEESALSSLIWSHTLLLIAYGVVGHITTIPYIELFRAGIEYYMTVAIGVAFLIVMSPWGRNKEAVNNMIPFTLCLLAANLGYAYLNLHSIGAVFDIFVVLLALEWIGYMAWSGGLIIGTMCTGVILYAGALVLEKNGAAIIQAVGF